MRLLEFDAYGELLLTENLIQNIPPYAILSHTWGKEGQEVTFNDVRTGSGKNKAGYDKIRFCGEQAKKDGLRYFWVDTCCINKSDIPELQQAIASMFRWYAEAQKCYVFLSDVTIPIDDELADHHWIPDFCNSRWFKRGWTLQELIAPGSVEFFSRERELLGCKRSLENEIHQITGIPVAALRGAPLPDFSVEERLQWTEKRQTKYEEDKAYCLLGIFDVSMSLRYGERGKAFDRLRKKLNAFAATHEKGLNLFDAPDIGERLFVGRGQDLLSMEQVLQPQADSVDRRVLVLGGMGGIGKTQLAVKFANKHHVHYSSIFWLNATSEVTLKESFRKVANRVFPPDTVDNWTDDQLLIHVSNWLSDAENGRWLLIFDNHDDPDLYAISKYYPSVTHGSIIITTRQPDEFNGERLKLNSMVKEEESLRILATRSGRENVESDPDARKLAERLDGHPLALTTAGAFLSQSVLSFSAYLAQYETKWKVTESSKDLPDYPSRSLYTTWDLSFKQIEREDVRAANLLRLLAYFDHQDIWYGLLQGDPTMVQPQWFTDLLHDEVAFEEAMQVLARYSLVNMHHETRSYSLHVCVHDWALKGLNIDDDETSYWLALGCTAAHVGHRDQFELALLKFRRFVPHGLRLAYEMSLTINKEYCRPQFDQMGCLANLLRSQSQFDAAERIYVRILIDYEKTLGPEHQSTLAVVHNLGALYFEQGKLMLAEEYYARALAGRQKTLGPEHQLTLTAVHNLGALYSKQGKLALAEAYYARALAGREKTLGLEHHFTLGTVHNLGSLYHDQGKLTLAEEYYTQALVGCEKTVGPEHQSTLHTINNLGRLHFEQGKLALAEEYYARVLASYVKTLGPEHQSTLYTVHDSGRLYFEQGKLMLAEEYYTRALAGYEKTLGPEHQSTLSTVFDLGFLYFKQGKLALAEEYCSRALASHEKASQSETLDTLTTVSNLGILCWHKNRMEEAEKWFQRALLGREEILGFDHPETVMVTGYLKQLRKEMEKSKNKNKGESAKSEHKPFRKRDQVKALLRLSISSPERS